MVEKQSAEYKIGEDYIGVTCIFVCHDGQGNILLAKRSQNTRDEQGRWDFGGGAMHHGETFEDTVKREVAEEYGTQVIAMQFAGLRNVIRQSQGKTTHWLALDFVVQVDPNQVQIGEPEKIDAIGWFPLNALPEPMHSQSEKILDNLRAIHFMPT